MPYLILDHALQFIDFMKRVFSAEETYKSMRDPATIMHAEVMVGECTIMCADATEQYPPCPAGMFIYVDDADAVFEKALKAGAQVIDAVTDHPYGRSGGILDPFGNSWWLCTAGSAPEM